jgi:hypothetical protein
MAEEAEKKRPAWLDELISELPEEVDALIVQPFADRAASCFPHRFKLDGKTRTVTCMNCKRLFDAFEALMVVSRDWIHYEANRQALRGDVERLQEKRERLRKQVQSLKAMVKRRGAMPEKR